MNREEMIEYWQTKLHKARVGTHEFMEVMQGYGLCDPSHIEIIVLEFEGRQIVYRYTDDFVDDLWQIGEIADAVDELLHRRAALAEVIEAVEIDLRGDYR